MHRETSKEMGLRVVNNIGTGMMNANKRELYPGVGVVKNEKSKINNAIILKYIKYKNFWNVILWQITLFLHITYTQDIHSRKKAIDYEVTRARRYQDLLKNRSLLTKYQKNGSTWKYLPYEL